MGFEESIIVGVIMATGGWRGNLREYSEGLCGNLTIYAVGESLDNGGGICGFGGGCVEICGKFEGE